MEGEFYSATSVSEVCDLLAKYGDKARLLAGGTDLMVLINPEMVTCEGECNWDEGCLSLPDFTKEMKRKTKVVVRCQNLEGETVEIEGTDLLAVALQHEIEHLDGVLLIDHASPLKRSLYKRQLQKEKKKENKP